MKLSQLYTRPSKTVPADEQAKNAQLLIRAGFVKKEMAGVYSYLPLGKRVIDKISNIVRDEMNSIGAVEIQMSVLQSKELWQKTDRWDDKKVDNWFKTKLSSGQEVGLGLTHEEPITDSLVPFVNSYKELPVYVYQIQSKFRNELRARSGLLRGRELLMKDLYSFSADQKSHDSFYEKTAEAYMKIYTKVGLGEITYRTYADGGIFSRFSEEFQTISPVGEDTIYIDKTKKIAVNREVYTPDVLKHLGLNKDDLVEDRAVEVGNIFHLGSRYCDALGLNYLDKNGKRQSVLMGCYGLGISRLMGLIAEHFADENGLVWPINIAPASIYLIAIGSSPKVHKKAEELYRGLTQNGVEVLYDDRDLRPGQKFAEADLLGIPFRVVINEELIGKDQVELKERSSAKVTVIDHNNLIKAVKL